jgi:hypothetical protein
VPGYTSTVPLRRIALLTLLAFGCATVRVPGPPLPQPADAPGTIAPPITELWIESSEEVPAELSGRMDAQARAALSEALEARQIPSDAAGAEDAVLFVRERAVATTEARNSQQTWAKVGIVVGIVLVIAAVVVIAVVSGGKSSSSHSSSAKGAPAPAKSSAPVAVKPRAVPPAPPRTGPPPLPPPRVIPPPPPPIPYAYQPYPSFFLGFRFDFLIPPQPMVLAPEPVTEEPWYEPPPPGPWAPDALATSQDNGLLAAPPPPDSEPMAAVALQLPPLAEAVSFRVEDRGFFAGPLTALQLDLVDRATGQLLWTKAVRADEDPLDPKEVSKLLDEAFAGVEWARRQP